MNEWMVLLVERWGYLGILFLIAVENIFPPIPSEVILTFGGFLTTYTSLGKWGVIWAATGGAMLGALILYGLGRICSAERLVSLLDGKIGRILHFDGDEVKGAFQWFHEKGKSTVLLCRCVPILRSLISIPAGMAGMPMKIFLPLTLIGSLIWNVILVNLGVIAGGAWEQMVERLGIYGQIVSWGMVIGVMILTGIFMKHLKKKIMLE